MQNNNAAQAWHIFATAAFHPLPFHIRQIAIGDIAGQRAGEK
jgi:hypothetical protein